MTEEKLKALAHSIMWSSKAQEAETILREALKEEGLATCSSCEYKQEHCENCGHPL
jgi:hypothetical protein